MRPHAAARTPAATTPLVAAQAVDPEHLATLGTALGTSYLAVDGGTLRALVPVTEGAADRTAALARLGWTLGFSSPVPASARVGIAHPLHLGETLKAWSEMFADYEILQPFPQLGRPVYALTENERASGELTRFEGVTVPVGALLGRRGWDRGVPQDNGTEHWISRPVEGGCVVINLDPSIRVGYVDLNPEQRLQRVWLGRCPDYDWSGRDTSRRFGELDPVTASEILADLTQVTRLAP